MAYERNCTDIRLSKLYAMWHPQLGWEGLGSDGAEVQDVYRSSYGCAQGYGGGSYGGYDPNPYSGFYTLPSFSSWSSTAPYYTRVGSVFWIGVRSMCCDGEGGKSAVVGGGIFWVRLYVLEC